MSIRSIVIGQFKQPHGFLGQIAGAIMASRPSNRERNRWTVRLLGLQSQYRVLEIGCGPGLALEACTKIVTNGLVVGFDHSDIMVAQAKKRLTKEIKNGKAKVILSSITDLTMNQSEEVYDRIYSLNVIQFCPDIDAVFSDLVNCLSEDGMVATTYQPRSKDPTRENAIEMAERIQLAMEKVGFVNIIQHELPLKPVPAICVTGHKKII